jgi:hypothetical protein
VRLTVLDPPSAPVVVEPRPYTLATVAFLLAMLLAVAVAYAWENLFPAGAARETRAPAGVTLVTTRNGLRLEDAEDEDGAGPAIALADQRDRR